LFIEAGRLYRQAKTALSKSLAETARFVCFVEIRNDTDRKIDKLQSDCRERGGPDIAAFRKAEIMFSHVCK
jgi:hypothetical protein